VIAGARAGRAKGGGGSTFPPFVRPALRGVGE
jgi:hypothetical protein